MGGGPAHEVYPAAPADDGAKDPVSKFERRDHAVRQKLVQVETAKLLRERVKQCYREEGVNHLQNCREHVQAYLEATKNIGFGAALNWNMRPESEG